MAKWGTVFPWEKYQSVIYFPVSTCFEKPFLPTWASAKSHNLHLNSVYALETINHLFLKQEHMKLFDPLFIEKV